MSGSNSCGVEDHTANLQTETVISTHCKTINIRENFNPANSMSNALNELAKSLTLSYCSTQ